MSAPADHAQRAATSPRTPRMRLHLRWRLYVYRKHLRMLGLFGAVERSWSNHFSDRRVRTPMSAFPLRIRHGTSDLPVFDAIFVDHEYRCIDHLKDVRTIIDAGANVGYSSAYFLTRFPQARVIAIEPDPGNFAALGENLAPWGDRVSLVQAALWPTSGTLSFRPETLRRGQEWGRQVVPGQGEVRAITLPDLMTRYAIDDIDLLKVDIEGAEQQVFGNTEPWLDRVRNIVIELHGAEARATFLQAIRGRGFRLSECDELTVCLS